MGKGYNAKSKAGEIIADPEAYAIFVKTFTEWEGTPKGQQEMAHGMSIKMLASFPQAKVSKEAFNAMVAELEAL